MNCKNVQTLLSAYLDEELAGREMLDIREHLTLCRACKEELRGVETVKSLLGRAPVPEPSADFEDRLVSHVLAETKKREHGRISILALTGIAAASMLATLLFLSSTRTNPGTISEKTDNLPYDLIRQNRAFDASSDPLSGSPVMMPMHGH